MPFVGKDNTQVTDPFPGFHMRALATKDNGAVALSVNDVDLDPDGGIPPHIHPTHEEAIVILEGTLEFLLGDETRTVGPGDTILAPAGVKHSMFNRSGKKARAITIFPTTAPQRTFL